MTPISATVAMEIRGDALFICTHDGDWNEQISAHLVVLSDSERAKLKAALASPTEGETSLMGGKAVVALVDAGGGSFDVEWRSGLAFDAVLTRAQLIAFSGLL